MCQQSRLINFYASERHTIIVLMVFPGKILIEAKLDRMPSVQITKGLVGS